MERRDFLFAGAASAAAAGSSCATLPLGDAIVGSLSLTPSELTDYLARVDRGLEAITRGTILPQARILPATATSEEREAVAREERLAKQGLRALLFSSAVNDLDARSQQHPEVRERLARMGPELDEAVLGMTARIAELGPERAAAVRGVLRAVPDLGLQLSEGLGQAAKEVEVPLKRRLQMRSMLTHFAWRMRVQSPTAVAEEYLTKMQKVAALHGKAEGLKRELAARLTEEAFWRYQDLVAQADPEPGSDGPPSSVPATRPSSAPSPASIAALEREHARLGQEHARLRARLADVRKRIERQMPKPAGVAKARQLIADRREHAQLMETVRRSRRTLQAATDALLAGYAGFARAARTEVERTRYQELHRELATRNLAEVLDEEEATDPARNPLPALQPEPRPKAGLGLMAGGGITAGIGALLLSVGGIVLGTSAGGVTGATGLFGAVLMTIGGIILLVGLIVMAASA